MYQLSQIKHFLILHARKLFFFYAYIYLFIFHSIIDYESSISLLKRPLKAILHNSVDFRL